MIGLLIKNFVRSKGFLIGLLALFFAGLISLQIGKNFLEKNEKVIYNTNQYQKESIKKNVQFHPNELGLLLYYVRFSFVNEMPRLTGLSIGQRDIHPSIKSVTIRNLEEQKYTSDLMNPMFQMLGNMDFNFVLIYLFPLIIIALCFNLISEEKEDGTWDLIVINSPKPFTILKLKLLIRFCVVLTLLILLFIIAKWYLSIPFDSAWIAFILISILYICFWFVLCYWVMSFYKSSSQNAMILLMLWIFLTIIIPASINALNVKLYPIPEAFSTVLESRDGYHKKWDKDKEATISKFFKHYPQFNQYKYPVNADFNWLWYYAMQQMGDDESAHVSTLFKEKLKKRNQFTKNIGVLFPTIHTQLSLHSLSLSGLENYLNYIQQLENFHEQKRLYYYPKIFSNINAYEEKWDDVKTEFFKDKYSMNWLFTILPFVVLILIFLLWAKFNFYKKS